MKASELPKNKRDSVRINNEVDASLRAAGLSVQKVLDWAIDQKVKIGMKMEVKGEKSK